MTTTTDQAAEFDAETQAILSDAEAAVREAKRVQPGARVHDLHSKMIGVEMHVMSYRRDRLETTLRRLPRYVLELRQLVAQIRFP